MFVFPCVAGVYCIPSVWRQVSASIPHSLHAAFLPLWASQVLRLAGYLSLASPATSIPLTCLGDLLPSGKQRERFPVL
jgi:hypothetical protein